MQLVLRGEHETRALGRWLATKLGGGQVLSLEGPLGAGKTTLLQGIAEGLGVTTQQTSPTFILFRTHDLPGTAGFKKSIKHLVHADAYRVTDPRELVVAGFTEFVGHADTLSVVEWGDRVPTLLPKDTLHLKLERSADTRTATLPAALGRPPKELFSLEARNKKTHGKK